MGMISFLNLISIGNMGLGIAASMRSDLVVEYTTSIAHVTKYANAGAKIAIKNSWIEKPPKVIDFKLLQERG